MRCLIIAAAIALGPPLQAAPAPSHVIVDPQGNVECFFGVPIDLNLTGLKRLQLPVTTRYERGEDDPYPVYTIAAADGVQIELIFEDDGKLYEARTASPNAVGPREIGVGSSLADVRKAWPQGKLLFGNEDGAFVTYVTGANLLFRFDPGNMPPGAFNHDRPSDFPVPDDIKVQSISIHPHRQ